MKIVENNEFDYIKLAFEKFKHVFIAHDFQALTWMYSWSFPLTTSLSDIVKFYNHEIFEDINAAILKKYPENDISVSIFQFFEDSKYSCYDETKDPETGLSCLRIPYPPEIEKQMIELIKNIDNHKLIYAIDIKEEMLGKHIELVDSLGYIYKSKRDIKLLSMNWRFA